MIIIYCFTKFLGVSQSCVVPESNEYMDVLKKHIVSGNQHYAQQEIKQAQQAYQQAIDRAEQLLEEWPVLTEAIAALLISYHNMGSLLMSQAKTAEGLACFQQAVSVLQEKLAATPQDTGRYSTLLTGIASGLNQRAVAMEQSKKPFEPIVIKALAFRANNEIALH